MSDTVPSAPHNIHDRLQTKTLPEFEPHEPELRSAELGAAIAYRIKLDPQESSGTEDQQTQLLNQLRKSRDQSDSSQWLLAYPDGQDGIIGFFWTKAQYDEFRTIVSKYHGIYGFGASRGESRITIVPDQDRSKGDDAVMVTCEATNAAARAVLGNGLNQRTESLDPRSQQPIFTHRYHTKRDGPIPEGSGFIKGDKDTGLEVIDIENYIAKQLSDPSEDVRIKQELSKLPGVREQVELETRTLEDQAELAVISVDINGMSSKIHELSSDLELLETTIRETQPSPTSEGDIKILESVRDKNREEIHEYLRLVATFFNTLEIVAREMMIQEIGKEEATKISLPDWRGDAGGIIVPAQYQDLLIQAFSKTVALFPDIAVKAYVKRYKQLEVKKGRKGRVLAGNDMLLDESVYGKLIKQSLKERNTDVNDKNPEVSGLLVIDESNDQQPVHALRTYRKDGTQIILDFEQKEWDEKIQHILQEMNMRPRG